LRDGQRALFETQTHQILLTLLTNPLTAGQLFTAERVPYRHADLPAPFRGDRARERRRRLRVPLRPRDGTPPAPALVTLASRPAYYITADTIYETPALSPFGTADATRIPADAVESTEGARLFDLLQTPLPARFAAKVEHVDPRVILECTLGPWPSRSGIASTFAPELTSAPAEPGEVYEPLPLETSPPPNAGLLR
jgi:hypothetical protein